MARRRFQDPEPKVVGNWWEIRVYQDEYANGRRIRPRRRLRLAPASMPIREVQKLKAEYLRPLNQGLITPGSATTFECYGRSVYIATVLPVMASSTQSRYLGIMENYLFPALGSKCLRNLSPLLLQRYISGFEIESSERGRRTGGKENPYGIALSRESVDKIRDVLSSILRSAVKYGYLITNPAGALRLPPPGRGRQRAKPFLRPEQFDILLGRNQEPYATMAYVAVGTGLRVSELIGLKWQNVHSASILIDERYCRGHWSEPKSEASNATIPVNEKIIERIHRLRDLTVEVKAGRGIRRYRVVKSCEPDDLVFQSLIKGRPMRDNNILVRHVKPAARLLGMPWVNWQVLRRSYSTWLRMVGRDPRDRKTLMRHSRFSTTAEIYEQDLPESLRRAVDKLGALVK